MQATGRLLHQCNMHTSATVAHACRFQYHHIKLRVGGRASWCRRRDPTQCSLRQRKHQPRCCCHAQVAAFGPAAACSLLFLGHIQEVSVSTWPADANAAVRVWQASLATSQTASGRLRVGECVDHVSAGCLLQAKLLAVSLRHGWLAACAGTQVQRIRLTLQWTRLSMLRSPQYCPLPTIMFTLLCPILQAPS